ncbi:hypothetical protein C5S35_02555 [Candidatus Methanophagaceae archaeon]|nr:hypothetical protein C5S35_02555 [Methanophagales archaeon]
MTTNTNAVHDAINDLTLGTGGVNYPEAYTRALYEAHADPSVGWRTGAKKIVIMFGDNIPHDIDPGRDGKEGTADDLDFEEVVAELNSHGITVLALYSRSSDPYSSDVPWKYMADETGGHYYELTEASKIPEAVTDMLVAEVDKIGELTLRAEPDYESWVSFTPNKYTNVGAKTTKTFTVKVTVPDGTKGGTYKFNIDVLGDGTVLAAQRVTVTVLEPTPRSSDVETAMPTRGPSPTPKRTRTYTSTPKPTRRVVPTSTPIKIKWWWVVVPPFFPTHPFNQERYSL